MPDADHRRRRTGNAQFTPPSPYKIPNFRFVVANHNFLKISADIAIGIYDSSGKLVHCKEISDAPLSIGLFSTSKYFSDYFTLPDLRDGTYTIVPICSTTTGHKRNWRPMYRAHKATYYLNIKNRKATLSTLSPDQASGRTPATWLNHLLARIKSAVAPSTRRSVPPNDLAWRPMRQWQGTPDNPDADSDDGVWHEVKWDDATETTTAQFQE